MCALIQLQEEILELAIHRTWNMKKDALRK